MRYFSIATDFNTFVPYNLPKDSKCNAGDIPTCCNVKATELLKTKKGFTLEERISGDTGCLAAKKQNTDRFQHIRAIQFTQRLQVQHR
ncbi:hypothetical protein KEM48_005867 [Puccinia striiformis f. sp. tritici PST-130]|nr:hypothetical protein KEM48_005867 [Puccinia striiformis f. sp. tritici PST-130]